MGVVFLPLDCKKEVYLHSIHVGQEFWTLLISYGDHTEKFGHWTFLDDKGSVCVIVSHTWQRGRLSHPFTRPTQILVIDFRVLGIRIINTPLVFRPGCQLAAIVSSRCEITTLREDDECYRTETKVNSNRPCRRVEY